MGLDDAVAWDHGLLDSWLQELLMELHDHGLRDRELLPCMGQWGETLQSLQSGAVEDGI